MTVGVGALPPFSLGRLETKVELWRSEGGFCLTNASPDFESWKRLKKILNP